MAMQRLDLMFVHGGAKMKAGLGCFQFIDSHCSVYSTFLYVFLFEDFFIFQMSLDFIHFTLFQIDLITFYFD